MRHRSPLRTVVCPAILLSTLASLCTVQADDSPGMAVPVKFETIEGAGGVPLNVVSAGNPAGPALLFIHGIGQSYVSFEAQFVPELARDYQLVAFDLRGHGNSGKPWTADAYTDSRAWADDVAKVIDHFRLQRPVLIGWSYGTLVVADYLRHHAAEPLCGIVLTGAYGGLTEPPAAPAPAVVESMQRNRARQISEDINENIAAAKSVSRQLTAHEMPEPYYERASRIALMLPGYARRQMVSRNYDNKDVVQQIASPMLLVVGGKDGSTPEPVARALASRVPDVSVAVYPDSGHSPFVEEPARFNAELAAFAKRCFTQGRTSASLNP